MTSTVRNHFSKVATAASKWLGSAWAFYIATFSVIIWAVSGPYFNYSEQWSLAVNTGTTIVTFLMVFLIQETQNRAVAAMNLKLDELVRVTEAARNEIIASEKLAEADIERLAHGTK